MLQRPATLIVLIALATGCVPEARTPAQEAVVTGHLVYGSGDPLPDDVVAVVRLVELGERERIVAEQVIDPVEPSPIAFRLEARSLDTTSAYGLHASIEDAFGWVRWETREPVRVLTQGHPVEVDVVLVEPERDPWARARRRGVSFRAVGQEPGWLLDVFGDPPTHIELAADYGEARYTFDRPTRETPSATRTIYHARNGEHTLRVVVDATPCTDIMSGEPFEATVTAAIDGRELHGCGRTID
jgi:uncharacterized membrane protein